MQKLHVIRLLTAHHHLDCSRSFPLHRFLSVCFSHKSAAWRHNCIRISKLFMLFKLDSMCIHEQTHAHIKISTFQLYKCPLVPWIQRNHAAAHTHTHSYTLMCNLFSILVLCSLPLALSLFLLLFLLVRFCQSFINKITEKSRRFQRFSDNAVKRNIKLSASHLLADAHDSCLSSHRNHRS